MLHIPSPATSKPIEKAELFKFGCYEFDSHGALLVPRNEGPYAGPDFERLQAAFDVLSSGGKSVESAYLRPAKNDNFRVIPIPLSGDQFLQPALEDLQGAFKIRQIESLVKIWGGDDTLCLNRASLQVNILTEGNESRRHEHRISDNRRWAFITMIHRSAEGSIFWTERPSKPIVHTGATQKPTKSPDEEPIIKMRELEPGDSIFFDASVYHGSTLTTGKGIVARAAWGFS